MGKVMSKFVSGDLWDMVNSTTSVAPLPVPVTMPDAVEESTNFFVPLS